MGWLLTFQNIPLSLPHHPQPIREIESSELTLNPHTREKARQQKIVRTTR